MDTLELRVLHAERNLRGYDIAMRYVERSVPVEDLVQHAREFVAMLNLDDVFEVDVQSGLLQQLVPGVVRTILLTLLKNSHDALSGIGRERGDLSPSALQKGSVVRLDDTL